MFSSNQLQTCGNCPLCLSSKKVLSSTLPKPMVASSANCSAYLAGGCVEAFAGMETGEATGTVTTALASVLGNAGLGFSMAAKSAAAKSRFALSTTGAVLAAAGFGDATVMSIHN